MSKFKDKIVWVTGASSGIGHAMARDFVKKGAKVILTARREDRLKELALQIANDCGSDANAQILVADLSDLGAIPALVEKAQKIFGRIDVLFNNAGISQRSVAMDTKFEVDQKMVTVDLMAPILLTKLVLPAMVKQGGGRILVTSSLMGYLEIPGNATYAAVKHAINGYFYSLAYEVEPKGILVQVIEPGFVKTEVTMHAIKSDGSEHGRMDSTHVNAMSAEKFSLCAFRQLERDHTEIIVAGPEIVALWLRRFCPGLYRFIFRKFAMKALAERFKD